MALSRGQEMTEQAHTQICGNGEKRYATREEFLKILDEAKPSQELIRARTGLRPRCGRCWFKNN
jgi:hypothetical protein